jgi:hypothetical protein
MALSDSPIAVYAKAQASELRAICDKLQAEMDKAIPEATSKIWHGSPVWFVGENPVVGYSVRQKSVDLMFWSGQLFEEPLLKAAGKDKAARVSFQDAAEINLPDLRRWLKKAGTKIFDYVGIYAKKRETPKSKPQRSA